MDKLKSILVGIGLAILGFLAFFTKTKVDTTLNEDKGLEAEQKALEAELEKLLDVDDLSPEEVEEFWKKKK